MIEIETTAHCTAPRSAVWSLLSDLRGWSEWGPWTKTELEGEGVGALRTMRSDRTKPITRQPYVMRERVTALEPETKFAYDLLSGLPVKNYSGEVTLSDAADGGTDIHWASKFNPPWPVLGGLWRGAMLKVITDVSGRLAAEADRRAGGSSGAGGQA
jgi:polyketide cyclase/dehydrase/lipid transport protein